MMGFTSRLTVIILVVGLLLPSSSDARAVDDLLPESWCILDGLIYPDGSPTSPDRCIQYTCVNGTLIYIKPVNPECYECSTSGKTSIRPYEVHSVDRSYKFIGTPAPYHFSQYGLKTPSSVGIETTLEPTNNVPEEARITTVRYKEFDTTIEFVWLGPISDAKILVNGTEVSIPSDGRMTSFQTLNGTVYVSNDSPSWPRPIRGGNIIFVGSQGLTVTMYALNGYAWFVKSFAMPPPWFENGNLYGLCDVVTPGWSPSGYTMQNGTETTDVEAFIKSWEVEAFVQDEVSCSCAYFLGPPPECIVTKPAPRGYICICTEHDKGDEPYCTGKAVHIIRD